MELPRNITQVGETDRNCKIYVEDYVVSYMKQMNAFAENKEIAIALYGRMSVEQQITYCFVYGACMVQSINREIRHLSQAQNQEVERMRRKYFPEQSFLGYQILNGDMIEGFRIYDQNSCRYVKGYACFFEKNDTMLAYMLEARGEEIQPERVEQDKYEMVKRRQEDRRQQFEERRQPKKRVVDEAEREDKKIKQFKVAPFLALAGCCLAVLVLWDRGNVADGLKEQLSAWVGNVNDILFARGEQNLEDEPVIIESEEVQEEYQAVMSTLFTEDKLADAILEENEKAGEQTPEIQNQEILQENSGETVQQPTKESQQEEQQPADGLQGTEQLQTDSSQGNVQQPESEVQGSGESQTTDVSQPSPETQESLPTVQQPQSYIIQAGDTLIAISTRLYGNDSKVSLICDLNDISNPDNIQIGQKILLP